MLAAGIGIGILVIPIMATVSEDALSAVPNALREASYGCGARKFNTVLSVVLPAAVSGIVAASIIAVSRAIGETMVATMAAGYDGSGPYNGLSPLNGGLVDDRRHDERGRRDRPDAGRARLRGAVPRRLPAVRRSRSCSTSSATASCNASARCTEAVEMALITPPPPASPRTTSSPSTLTRRDRDVKGLVLVVLLLVAALTTMLILFVLLAQIVIEAVPVFQEQGFGFLTGTIGSDPAIAGDLAGPVRIDLHRRRRGDHRHPARPGGGDLPRGVRLVAQSRDPADHGQHPQPGRSAGRHLRSPRPDHLRRVAGAGDLR